MDPRDKSNDLADSRFLGDGTCYFSALSDGTPEEGDSNRFLRSLFTTHPSMVVLFPVGRACIGVAIRPRTIKMDHGFRNMFCIRIGVRCATCSVVERMVARGRRDVRSDLLVASSIWRSYGSSRCVMMPNHALQRTRPSRHGCNPSVPRAGSLSLGR